MVSDDDDDNDFFSFLKENGECDRCDGLWCDVVPGNGMDSIVHNLFLFISTSPERAVHAHPCGLWPDAHTESEHWAMVHKQCTGVSPRKLRPAVLWWPPVLHSSNLMQRRHTQKHVGMEQSAKCIVLPRNVPYDYYVCGNQPTQHIIIILPDVGWVGG
jgi:hypothetical protein